MQAAKTKDYNLASVFFDEFKEAFQLHNNSLYWFGSLLSISDRIDIEKLKMDLNKKQAQNLMFMVNHALADLAFFYQKEPPEETFRFLEVARKILGMHPSDIDQIQPSYRMKMHQVHFNNTLALFGVKNKQYSFSMECFQKILEIYLEDSVDTATDIFLSALSNFLSFLRSYQYTQLSDKIRQVLGYFQQAYQNLLNKYMKGPCDQNSIVLMLSVYKQHELFLSKDFKAQNLMLIKKHGLPFHEFSKALKTSGKVNVKRVGELKIKRKQLNFFTSALPSHLSREIEKQKRPSLKEVRDKHRLASQNTEKFESVSSEIFLNIPSRKKIQQTQNVSSDKKTKQTLQKIQYKSVSLQKSSVKEGKIAEVHHKIYSKDQPLTIKVNYVRLEIIKEGLVISDFLREKKKFLTWPETFKLIKRFKFPGVFSYFLPVYTFYDAGKIIAPFLRKSQNESSRGFILCDEPKQFIEISVLIKTYKLEGPYLKLFAMNLYDVQRVEFWIDCYIHDFSSFFKQQTSDEYIQHLNNLVFDNVAQHQNLSLDSYNLSTFRKTRASVKEQLESQLSLDSLRDREDFKNSFFRVLLLMRGSKRILVFYDPKENKEEDISKRNTLVFSVSEIVSEPNKTNKLIVPTYKLLKYFPPCFSEQKWMTKLGFFILDAYIHSFMNYPTSFANQKFFNLVVYAKKVEMTNAGKYFVPVSAELIGSTNRIWGIVFRFFLQANIREETTFIYNPYHDLFSQALAMSPGKRKQLLQKQLFQKSVKKTYKRIVQKSLREKIVSISDYWDLIGF